jgi:hypothetical protein
MKQGHDVLYERVDATQIGPLESVAEGTIALPLSLTGLDPLRHIR